MATESSEIQKAEELVDKLQLLGIIKGPQQYFIQFFTANAGLVTSLGDLIDKIDKGTVTRNDYIDVAKDIAAIGVATAGLVTLATGSSLPGAVIGIGIGLAAIDYLDSKDYDVIAIKNDVLDKINIITNSKQSKHEAWESLTKEEQAKWIDSGGLPWNYDPNSKSLMELYGQIDSSIIDEIKKQMGIASQIGSPIVLDLNGDGVVETTSKGSVYFDHDANGFAEQTGWVGADDGLLIYDRNNNGKIDDGTELFGNNTLLSNGNKATNGFEALKEFDTNKDGVIDKSDEIYSQLKVWQDANQNGVVDEGELKTLEELGIESLNTSYVNSSLVDENNNAHKQLGSFTKDGQTYKMNDVWFDVDLARTKELNLVEASEEIQRLALVS